MSTIFHIDDMTIHRIVEYQAGMVPVTSMFPNLAPDVLADNRAWLRSLGALSEDDRIVLCFQSYLIRTPHFNVLVDTCVGNDKERESRPHWHRKRDDAYMSGLAHAGLGVDDIDFVMCTHMHVDHVGWNTRLEDGRWVPTFPNARYVFSKKELAYWTAQNDREPVAHLVDSVLPIVAAGRAELVTNTHACCDHVRLMPTPGHTIDHVAVALGRSRDAAIVTGDLIHSPLQLRHPELRMWRDYDPDQAVATRRHFLARLADRDTLCCTSHFPTPSVGHIQGRPRLPGYELVTP
jgi:glyoxylase-like metal-dependent hydrolase (beta-lactamase superfamily II)